MGYAIHILLLLHFPLFHRIVVCFPSSYKLQSLKFYIKNKAIADQYRCHKMRILLLNFTILPRVITEFLFINHFTELIDHVKSFVQIHGFCMFESTVSIRVIHTISTAVKTLLNFKTKNFSIHNTSMVHHHRALRHSL